MIISLIRILYASFYFSKATIFSIKALDTATALSMASCTFVVLFSFTTMWNYLTSEAKVYMVVMDEEPVISLQTEESDFRDDRDYLSYKERISKGHDMFLESLFHRGSYTKLYSYTHLLSGFAIHVDSAEVLKTLEDARGVRDIHEDTKMGKLTTHTPELLGIPSEVWPILGGAENSAKGVVIGFVDSGINPLHLSFRNNSLEGSPNSTGKFKGHCITGDRFGLTACNGKIVGARYFARTAIANGDFNSTRDYASPFDADGHGSHTASTAAGNHRVPVIVDGFNYGYASGMAPGARIAVYKAVYSFGGYMSDVVAAIDQAVEDRVDIISLSVGPSSVPRGPAPFLSLLEIALLFATKAGVLVVQAAGNGGPSSSSILSFSPWITSVAASTTDRKYNNTIKLRNGKSFSGTGLAPPTAGRVYYPILAAADACYRDTTSISSLESCQNPELFIQALVKGKLIICTYTFEFEYNSAAIATLVDTIKKIGAAGFILRIDPDIGSIPGKLAMMHFDIPGIILNNIHASASLWDYYNSNTIRSRMGQALVLNAQARLLDGRQAICSGDAPIVASYSSRGPAVNNAHMQAADILKPNIMAPGSSIWAAWSSTSEGDPTAKGQNFATLSGTSMATPHIAGIAALIKHKHPMWGPAAITSAMMTSADVNKPSGSPLLAQSTNGLVRATPFDFGGGFINTSRALDPGLIFNAHFQDYVHFLCSVPGVDDESVWRVVGVGCPKRKMWCSDLNNPSVTVSSLIGSRRVIRRVTDVSGNNETYTVIVREPLGVRVSIWPQVFNITGNTSRNLRIVLRARRVTRAYSFGEIVLLGNRNHIVRVPIAVYVRNV